MTGKDSAGGSRQQSLDELFEGMGGSREIESIRTRLQENDQACPPTSVNFDDLRVRLQPTKESYMRTLKDMHELLDMVHELQSGDISKPCNLQQQSQ